MEVDGMMKMNPVCLLSMCYCYDSSWMPGRRPGAAHPLHTSQITHNVQGAFTLMSILSWY